MTTIAPQHASSVAGRDTDGIDIKCVGLTKIFRDFWMRARVRAVDQIDLEVRRGEVFGLLGPNGSGKSTTIKMILGLLKPSAGRIAVFGKHPEDVETKKHIGYLPEESYLYRFLNARETLDYYGRLFHQARPQRMKRIDMLLQMVGLEAVQRRPVGEYSKGMQRRIGLAQALINDPQLLILDEPTTGMDPIGTRQIKDLLLQLRERGKTILLCSHLLADVEDVCDRVAVMYGGKVRREGTVDELLVQEQVTTIKAPMLSPELLARIQALLREAGKDAEVEHPRQRLEALFMDIVAQARSEGAATHGATSGGRIAEFLMAESGATTVPAAEVVAQLMQEETPAAPAAPRTEAAAQAAQAQEAEEAVLDSLMTEEIARTAEPAAAGQPADAPQADLAVIEGLMGDHKAPTTDAQTPRPDSGQRTPPHSSREESDRSLQDSIDELMDEEPRAKP